METKIKRGIDTMVYDESCLCSRFTPFTMADLLIFVDFIGKIQEKGDIKSSIKYKKKDIKRILGKEKMNDTEFQGYMNSIFDKAYFEPYDPFVGGYIFDIDARNENRLAFDECIYNYNIFNEAISNPDSYFISVSVLHSFNDDEEQLMSVPQQMTLRDFKLYVDILRNMYDKDGEVKNKVKYKDNDIFNYDEVKKISVNIIKKTAIFFYCKTRYSGHSIVVYCDGNNIKRTMKIWFSNENVKMFYPKERCSVESTNPIIYLSIQKEKLPNGEF